MEFSVHKHVLVPGWLVRDNQGTVYIGDPTEEEFDWASETFFV